MTSNTDWHYETTKAADYIASHRRQERFGGLQWEPTGTVLGFINAEDSADRRASMKAAQQAISVTRERLEAKGVKVHGVAGSGDNCTWVLLCTTDDLGMVQRAAYDGCQIVASSDPHADERARLAPLDKSGVPIDPKQSGSNPSIAFKRLL
ncbi:MAG TPA: hypothetical protein VGJ26_18715 [Pirellulales bacterium]|jgi:hypothetical protein